MLYSFHPRVPILPVCLGIGLLVAASGAGAQATSNAQTNGTMSSMQSTAKVSSSDKSFVEEAAIGGMAEVRMGKLAQQKAGSDQVKQFGTRMVDDHTKVNDDLKQVADSKGITLPTELNSEHKNKVAKLEKLSGAQFDRAYMDGMVSDHKKDIAAFEKQAKSAHDPDIKGFASKELPTLQEHLTLAESTDKAVKSGK